MEIKTTKLRESQIPQNYKMMIESEITTTNDEGQTTVFDISIANDVHDQSNDSTDMFDTLILTCASIMSRDEMKPKADGKSALVFTNTNGVGEVLMACIAEYTEEDGDGNWYFSFSFDPEDIKGIKPENVFNFTSLEKVAPFANVFNESCMELHTKRIGDLEIINNMVLCTIKTIYGWLDSSASETEIQELLIEGALKYNKNISFEDWENSLITFATASVEVVKGIKKMSMSFGEEMKLIAKGNSDSI